MHRSWRQKHGSLIASIRAAMQLCKISLPLVELNGLESDYRRSPPYDRPRTRQQLALKLPASQWNPPRNDCPPLE
jgi:hypothetical protein